MTTRSPRPADWDPLADSVLADQIAGYDEMRQRCPVAWSDYLWWSLFRHADVMRVLHDSATFSNSASNHLSIPNGMDPPEHTPYRRLINRYFTPDRMAEFQPVCERIASSLVHSLPRTVPFEVMDAFAHPFAVRIQCAFMGWPDSLHAPLREWIAHNHAATHASDRSAMARIALEFDGHIKQQLVLRRDAGDDAPDDVTTRLLRERVYERAITDEEIVSIVRNWTVGELGTIAASVGILMHYLAEHPELQKRLRDHPTEQPDAIDEILRIHAPLIANRRITTCPVHIGDRQIDAGERVTILWAAANRDEAVFRDPDHFDPERNRERNLLYGAGLHVCPGAPLARMELQLLLRALLDATQAIEPVTDQPPVRAHFPASGFDQLTLRIT